MFNVRNVNLRNIRNELASYTLLAADYLSPVVNAVKSEIASVADGWNAATTQPMDTDLAFAMHGLDPSSYKDLRTYRGLLYHYYFASPADPNKPFLIFLHGFPSTSYDWRYQAGYFKKKGYGLIVPDMLGYGGSDKPTEPESYRPSLICQDIVNIMDEEGVEKAIAIGHDWGSKIVSRLANYYPERFLGFTFIALGYVPPAPDFNIHHALSQSSRSLGYEAIGYWTFFAAEGSDAILQNHWDSFFSLVFPANPKLIKTEFTPLGALKAWLVANKTSPLPLYLSEEEKKVQSALLLNHGLAAPLNWYKVLTSGIASEDDSHIPQTTAYVTQPTLFIGCGQDYVCGFDKQKTTTEKMCKKVRVVEVADADHWVTLSHGERVCKEIERWLKKDIGLRSGTRDRGMESRRSSVSGLSTLSGLSGITTSELVEAERASASSRRNSTTVSVVSSPKLTPAVPFSPKSPMMLEAEKMEGVSLEEEGKERGQTKSPLGWA